MMRKKRNYTHSFCSICVGWLVYFCWY